MNATAIPPYWVRFYTLDAVSSQELMEQDDLACPLCGAPAQPAFLRASLSTFIAALACLPCRALFRAVDTFSLREPP